MPVAITPAIAAEIARLLTEAEVTQYRLRQEAGLSADTARILLGLLPGRLPSLESAERALALLKPPRQLWHRRAK